MAKILFYIFIFLLLNSVMPLNAVNTASQKKKQQPP